MTMQTTTFESRRVVRSFRQVIDGAADAVFPLLCPVREVDWLDGWSYRMIYSASGLVEDGAVFATSAPGEADTVWVVTRHDPAARLVEFTRVTPGSRVTVLRLAVTPTDGQRCHLDVCYSCTSLTPSGDAFLDGWTEEAFVAFMRFWERSMNHFLATGDRLKRE
jgi:hypothetical protein